MLTRGSRFVDGRAHMLATHLIQSVNKLANENGRLREELSRRDTELAEIAAAHRDEREAVSAWKATVAAREEAQRELLALYRGRAEGVRRGEPQRHWVH
jgi:hypothetical protein